MRLMLKGFSQDVNLADKDDVRYFLTFEDEAGREHRLPVPKETSEALISLVYSEPSPEARPEFEAPHEEQDVSGATEFGGDEEAEVEKPQYIERPEEDEGPGSEEEVASL